MRFSDVTATLSMLTTSTNCSPFWHCPETKALSTNALMVRELCVPNLMTGTKSLLRCMGVVIAASAEHDFLEMEQAKERPQGKWSCAVTAHRP
jgi:hypothetical protein